MGTASGLHLHHLCFFIVDQRINVFRELVSKFLQQGLALLYIVLGNLFLFAEIPQLLITISSDIPDRHFAAPRHLFDGQRAGQEGLAEDEGSH